MQLYVISACKSYKRYNICAISAYINEKSLLFIFIHLLKNWVKLFLLLEGVIKNLMVKIENIK
jgi:hypothetical protein